MVSNIGALTPVAGQPILFALEESNIGNKITYSAGIFTLGAGGHFLFSAQAPKATFSGATGLFEFRWRIVGATLMGVSGYQSAPTNVAHIGQCGEAKAILRTTTPIQVQCEAITTTAFTSIEDAWATVQWVG